MLLNTHDYRAAARRRLPRGLYDYIARGTEDEHALRRLRERLEAVQIPSRILTGHAARDLRTQVLGRQIAAPFIVAPTALAGLVADKGETKLARAAARAGVPFCISTLSITPMEAIRAGAPDADLWMQFYVWKDRALAWGLLDRARACGIDTLVLTVDTLVNPKREHNLRNGFTVPFTPNPRALADLMLHPRWLARVFWPQWRRGGLPTFAHHPQKLRGSIMAGKRPEGLAIDTTLSWRDLAEIRRRWPGKLVVKGILHPEDAHLAAEGGADGIVVSSHGARNLDLLPAPIDQIAPILDRVAGRVEVLADGGINRGTDVLRYVFKGARATMVGRLPLWGLAAGDEAGADAILAMLKAEIDLSMVFLGAARPDELAMEGA